MRKMKIGVVGCGNISDTYLTNSKLYDVLEVVAVCDIYEELAKKQAEKYGIKKYYGRVEDIIADKEVEVILNLTNPAAHFSINMQALEAGKHVYTEKTLAETFEEGKRTVEFAKEKGLRVGVAPDTFMGGRLQTCRKLLDDGQIGKPIAATAFFAYHGHEVWHPNPFYYYKAGAGPMFDEGPYYITALISLLGPAKRVSGSVQKTFEKRPVLSEPHYGEMMDVEIPTHVAGNIEFECGAVATVITSFDIYDYHLPKLEIYGTEGSMSLPEYDPLGGPNVYAGPLQLRRREESDWWKGYTYTGDLHEATPWREVPLTHGYLEGNHRILGLADMCAAIQTGRSHRASGDMGLHALEIMEGFFTSANSGQYYEVKSRFERPEPMEMNVPDYVFEK